MFRNIYTRRLPFLNTDLCFSPNPFIKGILSLVTDRNPTAHTVSLGALQAFAFFLFITLNGLLLSLVFQQSKRPKGQDAQDCQKA